MSRLFTPFTLREVTFRNRICQTFDHSEGFRSATHRRDERGKQQI